MIEDLRSGQGYLVFTDKVNIAESELFGLGPSKPVEVFTNASELNVYTEYPEAFQTLTADDGSSLVLDEVEQSVLWSFPPGLHEISTQKGGVTLASRGSGFSFSRESFFDPFPLKVEPYQEALLTTDIRYILGEYTIPSEDGAWLSRSLYFDLGDMQVENNKLRFALLSPNLQQTGGEIVLGSINIVLKKAGVR